MAQKAATLEISELMQFLQQELHDLPDERKPGNNTKYQVEDAVMAAFSVFFQAIAYNYNKSIQYPNSFFKDRRINSSRRFY